MTTPLRLPRAERRAQIIESAAHTFLRRGYDGTSLDDVAAAAGVSRLIIYRIFSSKDELYRAVLQTVIDAMSEHILGRDVVDLQRGGTGVLLVVARSHPDAFRLLWRHANYEPEFHDLARLVRRAVTGYGRDVYRSSVVDDDVKLEWAARTSANHLIESVCTWLDVGTPDRDDEFAARIDAGMRALEQAWVGPES